MDYLIVFIFGSIVGSFLNVCIWRLPRDESIIKPPSHCPACKKAIFWYDNIPLASYILLGGKCRFCRVRISFRYFLVELITAMLLASLYAAFGFGERFFAYSILLGALIVITFIDLDFQVIPDSVTYTILAAGLILSVAFPGIFGEVSRLRGLFDSLLGIIAGGVSIFATGKIGKLIFKKEAMGEGDVYLLAMIGSIVGWRLTLLVFFMAPIFGSVAGLILNIRDGRHIIPYGPYLSLAALVAVFFGEKILGLVFYGLC